MTVITDGDSDGGPGGGYAPRALSVAETKQVLPGLGTMPPGWQERAEPAAGSASPCHQGLSRYEMRPYEGAMMVTAEFEVAACRSVEVAAGGFREEVETYRTSNEATAVSFPGQADEATALQHVNTDLDETTLNVIARVGTVVCWMKLDPVDELDDHMALAEVLMGVCTRQAREVQAGS
ncbi:hypothetical protein [Streptomyces sp. 184]|uniref:hypothetical protein n=1 Tax=Streptomyces sp. 184 TaxID=1827526 RepID=UPI00389165CA